AGRGGFATPASLAGHSSRWGEKHSSVPLSQFLADDRQFAAVDVEQLQPRGVKPGGQCLRGSLHEQKAEVWVMMAQSQHLGRADRYRLDRCKRPSAGRHRRSAQDGGPAEQLTLADCEDAPALWPAAANLQGDGALDENENPVERTPLAKQSRVP